MPSNDEIAVNLYKINLDIVANVLEGEQNSLNDIPPLLVSKYNESRRESDDQDTRQYQALETANNARFAQQNNLKFYKKQQATAITHSWANFFRKQGIDLGPIQSATPNIVCFIPYGDDLFAFTTGSASVIFEQFIDQSFPIELAKRIVNPEVKGGKQQAISGAIQASDIYFRRPTRINAANSHQEVWKNLSGTLLKSVRESDEFTSVFGSRRSVSIAIKASIKISAKIDDPSQLVEMLGWIGNKVDEELSADQKSAFAFFDAIRPLTTRKDGPLIAKLNAEIAHRLLSGDSSENDISLTHEDASQFMNADIYKLKLANYTIEEWRGAQPDADDVSSAINDADNEELSDQEKLEKIKLCGVYDDAPYLNTEGSVIRHLSGELSFDDNTYYLLNGSWYRVEGIFQDITDDQLKERLETGRYTSLTHNDLSLSVYDHLGEPPYNAEQAGENKVVGDRVLYHNLELSDVLHYGNEEFVDIIHVKRELNGSVRDLVSQIRNAIETIENDLNLNKTILAEYYNLLESRGRIPSSMTKEDFLELFERDRRYVFAYIRNEGVSSSNADQLESSIAKNEMVSLLQYSQQVLRPSASLHLVWIPKNAGNRES